MQHMGLDQRPSMQGKGTGEGNGRGTWSVNFLVGVGGEDAKCNMRIAQTQWKRNRAMSVDKRHKNRKRN